MEPTPSAVTPLRAYGWALCSAAAAGTGAVVGKLGVEVAARPVFLAWLFAFGTLFSGLLTLARPPRTGRRLTPRGFRLLVVHALLGCLGCWGWYEGLTHVQAATAAFVSRAEVLIAIGLGVLLLRERLRWIEIVGGSLGICGLILMSLSTEGEATDRAEGVALVLLGSLGFGASELFAKRSVGEVDPGTFVLLRSALMGSVFIAWAVLGGWPLVPPPVALGSAAGVALLGPVVARLLYMHALHTLTLSRAALVAQTQPLFAALVGFLVLADVPTALEWAGGLLLGLGCALIVANARKQAVPSPARS